MSNSAPAAREKQHRVCKALLLGCVVALLGAACGQRGPLYLPQPESQPEPQPESQPAAATAVNSAQNEAGKAEEDTSEEEGAEEKDDE